MTDEERVETWRADQLLKAGYPPDLALDLAANTTVDLHQAVQLIHQGCPARIAYRILA